ncbi:MAG TPA: choice-of-anchor J domain-containing protein [Polyangia bacterium]|nr:choice-of-anchor J domain-containing protein [Polyangia bacterium]
MNGDFESGTANWGLTGDAYLASAPSCVPQSGSNYVFLCGLNSTSGSVYQDFSIAPGTNPRLTFWLHIYSDEGTASPFDYLYVEVLDTNSPLQQTLATYTNVAKTSVYVQQGTFSLGGFAGRTVRLRFRATTDGSNITTFRIDNVSVQY